MRYIDQLTSLILICHFYWHIQYKFITSFFKIMSVTSHHSISISNIPIQNTAQQLSPKIQSVWERKIQHREWAQYVAWILPIKKKHIFHRNLESLLHISNLNMRMNEKWKEKISFVMENHSEFWCTHALLSVFQQMCISSKHSNKELEWQSAEYAKKAGMSTRRIWSVISSVGQKVHDFRVNARGDYTGGLFSSMCSFQSYAITWKLK